MLCLPSWILDAHQVQLGEEELQVMGLEAVDSHVAGADGPGNEVGAGFDAVGDHAVLRTVQRSAALHVHRAGAGTLDAGAHRAQVLSQVDDLRLTSGVLDDRLALRRGGRHEQVLSGTDARVVEGHHGAAQAVARQLDEAVLDLDAGAELLEAAKVEVDASRPDVAAAGHGDGGPPQTGDHGPHDDDARPHRAHELVGRAVAESVPGGDTQLVTLKRDRHAKAAQNLDHGEHVGDAWHSANDARLGGEQAGGHELEGRVLGSCEYDVAGQSRTAPDHEATAVFWVTVHEVTLSIAAYAAGIGQLHTR